MSILQIQRKNRFKRVYSQNSKSFQARNSRRKRFGRGRGSFTSTTATATVIESSKATAIFSLFNLGCSSCSGLIERKLKKLPGIRHATVNYVTDTVLVRFDPAQITTDDVRSFMKKLGYDAAERG